APGQIPNTISCRYSSQKSSASLQINYKNKNNACERASICVKIDFDNLRCLFWRRKEFPFLHSVLAGLYQKRMTADHASAAYVAIGRDDDFDLYFAGYVHPACELRIGGRIFRFDLTFAFIGCGSLG